MDELNPYGSWILVQLYRRRKIAGKNGRESKTASRVHNTYPIPGQQLLVVSHNPQNRTDQTLSSTDNLQEGSGHGPFGFGLGCSGSRFQVLESSMDQDEDEPVPVQRLKENLQAIPAPLSIPKITKKSGHCNQPKI